MKIYTKMKTCFSLICLLFGFGFLALGQEPGDVLWEFQTGPVTSRGELPTSYSSPSIGADGTVYYGTASVTRSNTGGGTWHGKVVALHGKSGTKKWECETGDDWVVSAPAIGSDGTIYVGSYHRNLHAINPDGTKKWELQTARVVSTPAIGSDGTIYVGSSTQLLDSSDDNFYAINPDGTKKWAFKTGRDQWLRDEWSSPAIGSDGTVYVGSEDDGKIYALDGRTGAKQWEYQTGGSVDTSLAIGDDGTIYVGSSNYLYAINPDGTKKWAFKTQNWVASASAIGSDGTIYVASLDKNLYAINPDGTKKWAFEMEYPDGSMGGKISPAIGSDGTIYVGLGNKNLYAINPDGTRKWAFKTATPISSSPVIGSDGTLYFGTFSGKVYALKTSSSGPADSPWPMFGQNAKRTSRKMGSPARVPPTITTQPISQTVDAGTSVTFSVTATGTQPLSYRWIRNEVFLGPATESPTLTLGNVQSEQAGTYRVMVSNAAGTVMSGVAGLVVKETLGQEPGDVIWEFEGTPGGIWTGLSTPAIGADGTVYLGSSEEKLYALDGRTGAKKWEFNTDSPGASVYYSPAIGADGTVYVATQSPAILYALDGRTGVKKWAPLHLSRGLTWDSAPAIGSDGTVYIGNTGSLWALNGKSGDLKWTFNTTQKHLTSTAIGADGTIYFGANPDMTERPLWVYALNGKTGKKKWEFTAEGYVSAPAIGADGTVYVGNYDNKVWALNGKTGAKKWESNTSDDGKNAMYSSPVIGSDGTVYIGSSDGKFYALNRKTGKKKWEFRTGCWLDFVAAIGSDGIVYIGTNGPLVIGQDPCKRRVYALNGKTGKKKWEFNPGDEVISDFAIGSDGTLYIVSRNKLYALKTSSSGPADSAWPMAGQNAQRTGRKMTSPARVPPTITTQPISRTVDAGTSVTFSVTATGTQPLSYRWIRNGVFLGPATESPTLTLGNVQPEQAGTYRAMVSNAAGTVTSGVAGLVVKETLHTLTVASRDPDSGITVTVSPADQNGQAGGTTQFIRIYSEGTEVTLTAEQTVGANQFKQWLKNGVYETNNPKVTVTMDYNRILRAVYEVGILSPVITTHPIPQTVDAGTSVTFSVTATGTQPLSYRWIRNGVFLGPATESPTLTLGNVQPEQAGTYRAMVSNAAGTVTSGVAGLVVKETLHTLTVASRDPDSGVTVTVSPEDWNGQGDGTTLFTRVYPKGTEVTLSAKQVVGVNQFKLWLKNGVYETNNPKVTVTMDYNRILRAVYEVGILSPVITTHPISQTVDAGTSVTFSVTATGTQPLDYQWYKSGKQIAGATSSIYRISKVSQGDFVIYSVRVKNVAGKAISQVAELSRLFAPKITLQPQSQSVVLGDTAEFTIKASGTEPLDYQWYKSGKQIAGATSSIYRISKVSQGDFVIYSVRVKNIAGKAISQVAELSQLFAPKITLQPQSQGVVLGDTAEFTIKASGTEPLDYQWYKSGKQIAGATSSIYRISKVSQGDFVIYSVRVKNIAGKAISQVAELSQLFAPKITLQPQSQGVVLGDTAEFTIKASGTEPLDYQWYKSGKQIAGATSSIYRISKVSQGDFVIYSVRVKNVAGKTISKIAELALAVAPRITLQPQSQSVVLGDTAEFTTKASGTEPLDYQWYKSGKQIAGATSSIYRISKVSQGDFVIYSVRVKNVAGKAISQVAELSRLFAPKITLQPQSQSVVLGDTAEFTIKASGTEPFEYQWYKDGKQIEGAIGTTYQIASVSQNDLGIYSVWAQNKLGRAYSQTVKLRLPVPVLTYEVRGNTVAITDCLDIASGPLEIPSTYEGKLVTSIGNYAFKNCSSLTSVTIPDSVTSIGISAFNGCSSLTSITIPDSVTSIGPSAFSRCSSLTNVTIGNGVIRIGWDTFRNCSSLTSVTIPDSVTSIGDSAFLDCSSLTSVTIGNSVTIISSAAFWGCSSLTGVTIPESVTSIGDYAFLGCSGLTSITFEGNAPSILGGEVFSGVSKKAKIFINLEATGFGETFGGLPVVYESVFPTDPLTYKVSDNRVTITDCKTSAKGDLVIPTIYEGKRITRIGDYAFEGCSSLTSVTIPESVTSIGNYAFNGCSSLTSLTIPDSVNGIGSYAFQGCSSLTSVTIPNRVTRIGNYAFWVCSGLTSVTIGNGVTIIGKQAFAHCSNLTSVTIPDSVTSIGYYAFGVCSGLTGIEVGKGNTKYSSEDGVLFNKNKTKLIQFPAGKSGRYTIPNSVTSISSGAFWGCGSLTGVTIPDSVTSIRNWAFKDCSSLTSITFDGNAPSNLGDEVFSEVSKKAKIFINPGATGFGEIFGGVSVEILERIKISTSSKSAAPFTISFESKSGSTYEVQVSQDLKNWSKLEEVKGRFGEVKFADPRLPKVPFKRNYFRVKLVE